LSKKLQLAEEPDDAPTKQRKAIRALLGANGALARRNPLYEERPQQISMAESVADALRDTTNAVIEAGTGTGKTLAYLIPALLSGKRVVISTATKALQEQLVEKDLPLLQQLLGDFSYAVMKGRQNYLCLLRQEQFDAAPIFVTREEAHQYVRLRTWAAKTTTGDRAEVDIPENYVAWRDVSSTTETCLGDKCPRYTDCHIVKMRQKAQTADIVVVNHHLFFADLALRQSPAAKVGAEVIPRYEAVIFDEAHNIEEVATNFFGAQTSNWKFVDLCRDIDRLAKVRESWPSDRLRNLTSKLSRGVEAYFQGIAALAPPEVQARPAVNRNAPRMTSPVVPTDVFALSMEAPKTLSLFDRRPEPAREVSAADEEVLARSLVVELPPEQESSADRREARWTLTPRALDPLVPLRDALMHEIDELKDLFEEMLKGAADAEVDGFKRRAEEMQGTLRELSDQADPTLVYWVDLRGRTVVLQSAPINVAQFLRRSLFDKEQSVILTSATLATGGDTRFFRQRLGLLVGDTDVRPTRELVLPSPFDYARQAAIYVPRHLPDPTDEEFIPRAVEEIAALIALAKARTFVLFTSFRAMNEVHRRLGPRIPYRVLLQGQKPKGALIREFREEPSVLFATQSFWEGVDIQGDALSMVIIDKLPFASPGDPLVAARLQAITDRGGSPFGEYQLPSAAISLKQGFGRLIRSRQDTGAVAILDRRLWTKAYGSYFLKSLPPCPKFDGFPDLKRWWRETRLHD
jgi:ATP-dependent DNA helicase DinG